MTLWRWRKGIFIVCRVLKGPCPFQPGVCIHSILDRAGNFRAVWGWNRVHSEGRTRMTSNCCCIVSGWLAGGRFHVATNTFHLQKWDSFFSPTSGKLKSLNTVDRVLGKSPNISNRTFFFFKSTNLTIKKKTLLKNIKQSTKHQNNNPTTPGSIMCLQRNCFLKGPHLDKVNYCTIIAF